MAHFFKPAIVIVTLLCATWAALAMPNGMASDQAATFGIVLVTLSLWGTGLVPGYVASTFFFTALLLGGLSTPDIVFSGFTSSAMWLIVAGFVIGAAITNSGLGARIGEFARIYLSKSYPILIGGLMLLSMALGFIMPSSVGRAAVMIPIGMALAEVLGLKPGTPGRTGIAVLIAIGTNMPSFAILPSNIPNIVMSGLADQLFGLHFGYTDYLLLHYPVLGILKSAVIVGLVLYFFPAKLSTVHDTKQEKKQTSGRKQLVLLTILLMTLVMWSTDQLHGINPAWIGLATALVLMVPQFGFIPPPAFKKAIDAGTLFFIAGALALGVVVNASGLGDIIAREAFEWLPMEAGNDFRNFMSLTLIGAGTSIFTTMPGVPAVLTPLASEFATASGFSLEAVLMAQVIGFSTVVFPYQVGPFIIAMGLAGEAIRPLMKVTLALCAITILILAPIDFLWWKLLGMI
ncbi:SLC13 family permease [Cohaesibacter celericrescens]|uniref:SLC13 family permease n=1 Tax=Cohaesibacter celericrescens TaxID=2067669 RepID=UPI00356AF39E